ncbi:Lipopolysaccharide export system permease protein LptG [Tritonibacter multivorans]|uniref:Lipopolysaccharide export system permease protein LptG n=1 Tax=Tritonibacter multivorans TaxID=928856 RepID=A0A0P1GHA6_9RHOB|nr:LPS export ABC transporter permease LptG [Tritonibacter multivorans]MDA7420783.1 LPS export ABC transporter permease LptG [Tritonibacter multivorans]CUH80930.1 Lipopolysaccharide export system permease protein LptG [Tritonibacter multivorans]SFC86870.1 lipopolysaccharide export system permease protein [Tritonibacter multivorans]
MKLDLYYARRFLTWFVMISVMLMTLVLLIDFSEQLRRFDGVDLSAMQLLALALLKSPAAFYEFLPLIMILTTIVLFIGLARSSELVVTRAIGRSGIRALVPPVIAAFLIGGLTVSLLNPIVAATANRYKTLSERYRNADTAAVSLTGEGLWLRQGGDTGQSVIHAGNYSGDADTLVLFDVSILAYDAEGSPKSRTLASQARLENGDWLLQDAKVWPLAPGLNPELGASQSDELRVPTTLTNEQIRETLDTSEGISVYDLPRTITALQQAGFSTTRFQVWLQVELARPLFLVAMVMVGAAFTMRHARLGGTGLAVLASILLGFGLYFVHNFAQILGENGQIPVALAAWAPPVASILLTMGLLLHAEDG